MKFDCNSILAISQGVRELYERVRRMLEHQASEFSGIQKRVRELGWGYEHKTIGLRMGVQFSHSLADGKNRIAVKLQLTGKSRLTFQFYSTISPRS